MGFLIRIELHRTHDYTKLHAEMLVRNMTRTIPSNKGDIYELPTGTYWYGYSSTAEAVRDAAQAAATAAGHADAAIVVVERNVIAWTGLKLVRKAA